MNSIFEQLQAFVKDLQARFNNLSTPLKFLAGLAIFTLVPCVAVCSTKWKGWVKALTCFLLFCFMLGILMVAFWFYLIWFIWKKTGWKTYLKAIVTAVIIVVPVTLGIVFGEKSAPSDVPAPSNSPEIQIASDVAPPENEVVPPATQPPADEENDYQEPAINENAASTAPSAEDGEDTPSEAPAEDEFEWLTALGNMYPGVELYMVIDGEPMLYGVVTELDTVGTQVQVYRVEADDIQWLERRTPLFTKVLKVRSDDAHLPQY